MLPSFPLSPAPSLLPAAAAALFGLASCGDTSPGTEPPARPGPGVIYSTPAPHQLDVSVDASITVAFSVPVQPDVRSGCAPNGGALPASICVVDDDGDTVGGTARVVGAAESALELVPAQPLDPGRRYSVYVDPELIEPAAENAAADSPLFTFTTRSTSIRHQEVAFLRSINGEVPGTFAPASNLEPRVPLVDVATIRLLFSEPIDEHSARLGEGISLAVVDDGSGAEVHVAARLLVDGIHATIDPDEALVPGTTYQLRIGPPLRDRGGETVAEAIYELVPRPSHVGGELYRQVLDVSPARGDDDYPARSDYSPLDVNSMLLSSTLLGDNVIQVDRGALVANLAHPDQFTTVVPVFAAKGQCLSAPSMAISFGGVISTGVETGGISICFVSDVTGALIRNPFWPEEQVPDNDNAPLHVTLTFDASMSGTDLEGNAGLTQTLLGVQVTGLATVRDGQLSISNIGSMELNVLDAAVAPVSVSLSMSTTLEQDVAPDTEAPVLLDTKPAPGMPLLEDTDSVLFAFSEPVRATPDAVSLVDESGAAVPIRVAAEGSLLVVTPRAELEPDARYQLSLANAVDDLSGNRWTPTTADPTAGSGHMAYTTPALPAADPAPPALTAVYPGVPCALVDGDTATAGRCAGGESDDAHYQHFELPIDAPIDVSFDQPIDDASLVLGEECGEGSIRVEAFGASGCSPVPGTLLVRRRGFRFVPAAPLELGASYRLILHAGSNSTCGNQEICGANGMALNTDPLAGMQSDDGGGPDVVIRFVATEASSDPLLSTPALPRVDGNGNGFIDSGELTPDTNRAAVSLADTGGIVSSASIDGEDCHTARDGHQGCIYLGSELAVTLGEAQADCTIDTAGGPLNVPHCMPVYVEPPVIYGTSLTMDASVLGLGLINDLDTGRVALRVRDDLDPVVGWIFDAGNGPELAVVLHTYMDAPDLTLLGGLSSHDLHSKPLSVPLRGPIELRRDGRLVLSLRNETDVEITVGVSALGIGVGSMTLLISAGDMVVDLMSQAPHGGLQ